MSRSGYVVITGAMIYDEFCLITFLPGFNVTAMKLWEKLPAAINNMNEFDLTIFRENRIQWKTLP